jgi:hypothetical protein
MNVIELISTIRSIGGAIIVAGESVTVSAPIGTLTSPIKQAVRDNKHVLCSLYSHDSIESKDRESVEEREAIQWLESRPSVPECEQSEQCQAVEPEPIIDVSFDFGQAHLTCDASEVEQSEQRFDDLLVEPIPCPTCGGIMTWWDLYGAAHCDNCHPPIRSQLVAARVARLKAEAIGDNGHSSPRSRSERPKRRRQPVERSSDNILHRLFNAWGIQPRVCPVHHDPAAWIESIVETKGGKRIRTVCSACGGFVGYRLPEVPKTVQKGIKTKRPSVGQAPLDFSLGTDGAPTGT